MSIDEMFQPAYRTTVNAIKYQQDPLAMILSLLETEHSKPNAVSKMCGALEHDPVATRIEIRDDTKYDVCVFSDKAKNTVTPEHLRKSKQIRDYYGHKFFINTMKGKPPRTAFQQTLARILAKYDNYLIEVDELKILVKLLEFYEQDQFMDTLSTQYNTDAAAYHRKMDVLYNDHLEHIGTLHIRTRYQKIYRYFFKHKTTKVIALDVEETNKLLPLLNKIVESDSFVIGDGMVEGDKIRGTNYGFYRLVDWELA